MSKPWEHVKNAAEESKLAAEDVAQVVEAKAENAVEAAQDSAHHAKDAVVDAAESVKDKAHHAKEAVGDAWEATEEKAQDAKEWVEEKAHDVKDGVEEHAHHSGDVAHVAACEEKSGEPTLMDKVGEMAHDVGDTMAKVVTTVTTKIGDVVDAVRDKVSHHGETHA